MYQYVDTIGTAAESFVWENVYQYDQTFRQLITMFPNRSWAVLYMHGWGLMSRDHIPKQSAGNGTANGAKHKRGKSNEVYWNYNKSKCTYGTIVNLSTNVPLVESLVIRCQLARKGKKNRQRSNLNNITTRILLFILGHLQLGLIGWGASDAICLTVNS